MATHGRSTSEGATVELAAPGLPMARGVVMRTLAAMLVAACGGAASGDRVALLTDTLSCYAGGEHPVTAVLVADAEYGTTLRGIPVVWPTGYAGRRVGSQIEVLDAAGTVRATTGKRYYISPAYDGKTTDISTRYPAAVECGYEWDFGECDTAGAPPDLCEPGPVPGGTEKGG